MKKFLCIVLSMLMLFAIAPCTFASSKPTIKVAIPIETLPRYSDFWKEFDISVMKELAKRMGYSVEYISKNENDILDAIETGETDCAIGALDQKYRMSTLAYTVPYFSTNILQSIDAEEIRSRKISVRIATKRDTGLNIQFNNAILSMIKDGTIYELAKECGIEDSSKNTYYVGNSKFEYFINKELLESKVRGDMLLVKDAWILSEDNVLVLMESGELYSGKAIDEQLPKLVADNVKDVQIYFTNPLKFSSVKAAGNILYYNGDVSTIQLEVNGYGSKEEGILTIGEPKKYGAKKISSQTYIDKHNTLKLGNTTIMEDVENFYYSNHENFAITVSGDLYVYSYSESSGCSKEFLLSDVKELFSEYQKKYIILRNNGDLYYLENGETPIRIGTNVNSIKDVVLSNSRYIYYIDYIGRLYYCDVAAKEISAKYMALGIVEIHDNMGTLLAVDNSGYRYIVDWSGAHAKKYGYKKYFDNDHYEDTDGFLHSYDAKYNIKDVKKVISNGDMQFLLKLNGELWATYRNNENKVIEPFLTSFSQKRMKVIINNQEVALGTKIQIVNDRSMYPFRECLENMGASVMWDSVNRIAIGEYNGIIVEFPIGKKEYYVNGKMHTMDVASYIDSSIGRTYIPIRYAAEALGFAVNWKEGLLENIISIHK